MLGLAVGEGDSGMDVGWHRVVQMALKLDISARVWSVEPEPEEAAVLTHVCEARLDHIVGTIETFTLSGF